MKTWNTSPISPFGQFTDPALEREYQNFRFRRLKNKILPVAVILSFLYFLFLLPDCFFNANRDGFYASLAVRIFSVALFFLIYFALDRVKVVKSYHLLVLLYELYFPFSYLLLIHLFQNHNLMINCMDVILIDLLIFAIPSYWLLTISTAFFNFLLFFIYAHFGYSGLPAVDYAAVVIYLLVIYIINCIAVYRTHVYKRKQFLDKKKLRQLAMTDSLTGILNRAGFSRSLENLLALKARNGKPYCLSILDIDDFKMINDTYGHITGDHVLRRLCDVINNAKRPSDLLARWGGEEFIMIMPSADLSAAEYLVENIRRAIEQSKFPMGTGITCSFGVTAIKNSDTPESLVQRADLLLYHSKRAGKNMVTARK